MVRLGIPTDRFGKGKNTGYKNKGRFKGSDYQCNKGWRRHLIRINGHKCESCGLSEWLGKLITLELEHIDGNNKNYEETNLKLLCPNCHSQTPTWKRRKDYL